MPEVSHHCAERTLRAIDAADERASDEEFEGGASATSLFEPIEAALSEGLAVLSQDDAIDANPHSATHEHYDPPESPVQLASELEDRQNLVARIYRASTIAPEAYPLTDYELRTLTRLCKAMQGDPWEARSPNASEHFIYANAGAGGGASAPPWRRVSGHAGRSDSRCRAPAMYDPAVTSVQQQTAHRAARWTSSRRRRACARATTSWAGT